MQRYSLIPPHLNADITPCLTMAFLHNIFANSVVYNSTIRLMKDVADVHIRCAKRCDVSGVEALLNTGKVTSESLFCGSVP